MNTPSTTARRPYKVTLRFHGRERNYCERTLSYSTRERAFDEAATRLADRIADMRRSYEARGERFDAASWDAVVIGPEADLHTGRAVRHDGAQVDLIQDINGA